MDQQESAPGLTSPDQSMTKIHVSELRLGMFVSKLDRDWLETPFLVQGFLIKTPEDIKSVSEYAQYVWIDNVKGVWAPPSKRLTLRPAAARKKVYVYKVSAQEEHERAFYIFTQAREFTRDLLENVRLGEALDTKQAKATVRSCVDSILRNPDALLWMTKIRAEDEYTAEHCLNVCILAIAFGRHLGMSETDLQKIGLCGLLHDVGKMRIPPTLLNKPSALTPKESKQIRAHAVHGRNLLLSTPGVDSAVVDVAYSHHERIDGRGYPRKLIAEDISRFARMVSLVDAYDAMTADRCYAPAMPTTLALRNIYKDRGKHFDEKLALAFIQSIGLYPPGTVVQLRNDYAGIVVEANRQYRHLPKIILVKRGDLALEKEQLINLADVEAGELDRGFLIKAALRDGAFGIYVREYYENGLLLKGVDQ